MTTRRGKPVFSLGLAAILLAFVLLALVGARCGPEPGAISHEAGVRIQRLISAADQPSEYKNIWGKTPSTGQLNRQNTILREAEEQGLTAVRPALNATAADTFWAMYRDTDAKVVTLIGHNDQGTFRFPDGSPLYLSEIPPGGGPLLALVSCDSAKYASGNAVGIPTAVTIQLAVDIERRFVSKVNSLANAPSAVEAQGLLVDSLQEATSARTETYMYYVIEGGGVSLAGIGIYEVVYS